MNRIPLISSSDAGSVLSVRFRLIGFVFCFLFGILITITSSSAFTQFILGHPLRFSILYSLGNLVSLFSTFFLVGPQNQINRISSETSRAGFFTLFLSSNIVLLFSGITNKVFLICLISIQFISLVVYSLSYIPFGNRIAMASINRVINSV
jgi:hypothetical protein